MTVGSVGPEGLDAQKASESSFSFVVLFLLILLSSSQGDLWRPSHC